MNTTARRGALEALKRQRPAPAPGPLFAPEEAEQDESWLDRVAVLFPLPLPEPFDYRAPASMGLLPGMHVIAPIGPRLVRGVVWSVEKNYAGAANLKAIEEVLPGSAVPDLSLPGRLLKLGSLLFPGRKDRNLNSLPQLPWER